MNARGLLSRKFLHGQRGDEQLRRQFGHAAVRAESLALVVALDVLVHGEGCREAARIVACRAAADFDVAVHRELATQDVFVEHLLDGSDDSRLCGLLLVEEGGHGSRDVRADGCFVLCLEALEELADYTRHVFTVFGRYFLLFQVALGNGSL